MNDERCVRDRVTAILTLAEAATPGPWVPASWDERTVIPKSWADEELSPDDRGLFTAIHTAQERDARYIVAVCNDAPALLGRLLEALDTIDRAKALHRGRLMTATITICEHCRHPWPCPTWQALNPTEGESP